MREWLRALVTSFKYNPRRMIVEIMTIGIAVVAAGWVSWFIVTGDTPDPDLPLGPVGSNVMELDGGTLTQVDLPELGIRCWTLEPRGIKAFYSSPGMSCVLLTAAEQCPDTCYTPMGMLREYSRLRHLAQELQDAKN